MADLKKRLAAAINSVRLKSIGSAHERAVGTLLFRWKEFAATDGADHEGMTAELEQLLQLLEAAANQEGADDAVRAQVLEMLFAPPAVNYS